MRARLEVHHMSCASRSYRCCHVLRLSTFCSGGTRGLEADGGQEGAWWSGRRMVVRKVGSGLGLGKVKRIRIHSFGGRCCEGRLVPK